MATVTMNKHDCQYRIFYGTIVHCLSPTQLDIQTETYVVVSTHDGTIRAITQHAQDIQPYMQAQHEYIALHAQQFLCPGFIDTHTHAPQYQFTGTGRLPLLQWLETYTFPTEKKFNNLDLAKQVYTKSVRAHLRNGTTTCCYYATIHTDASVVLANIVQTSGQRAFIGKVCMDRNSPQDYIEASTEESIQETQRFVHAIQELASPLITPILTPRFVPTCSSQLMKGLGQMARQHDLPIQTHISENVGEIAWVRELHPECCSYTDVYDKHDLLTSKTILAHGIHLSSEERQVIKSRGTGISHCPNSNYSLNSGIMDARLFMQEGIKLSLGTDVAGGYSPSMLNAIRETLIASKSLSFQKSQSPAVSSSTSEDACGPASTPYEPLSHVEAFYLATLGGAQVVELADTIGNFLVGKEFDALLVDLGTAGSPVDIFETDSWSDKFQKFLFNGDDRNISTIYVRGQPCILP